jgi:hypothetical protein
MPEDPTDAAVTPLADIFREAHRAEGRDNAPSAESVDYRDFMPERRKAGRLPLGDVARPNRQAFELQAEDTEILDSLGDAGLHNGSLPQLRVTKESPEHRFLVYLFAQGKGLKDVFVDCGGEWDTTLGKPVSGTGKWSYPYLCQLRRQPWFQAHIIRVLEEAGKDRLTAVLETEIMPSLDVIREIRDDPEEKGTVRLAAANFFFDRLLGKPTQHVKTEQVRTTSDFEADRDALQKQLAELNDQIANLNAAQ